MISLTKEKREELVLRLKIYTQTAEIAIKAGWDTEQDLFNLEVRKIALASLTAEPEYFYRKRSDGGRDGPLHKSETEPCRKRSWDNLYTAPPVPEIKLSLLQLRDLEALIRFNETCEDGEGYDLSKDKMDRLVELGVVRKIRGSIREITSLGQMYIDINCQDSPSEFLMTETDRAAAFNQHIKRLNGLGE